MICLSSDAGTASQGVRLLSPEIANLSLGLAGKASDLLDMISTKTKFFLSIYTPITNLVDWYWVK